MTDDDAPRPRPTRLTVLPFDALGIDEIEAYVAELRAEIARADEAVARKRADRARADAVFGRPKGG